MPGKQKQTILFDIDKTLLDTDSFAQKLCEMVADVRDVPFEQVEKEFDEYIDSLPIVYFFDFIEFVGRLGVSSNEKTNILQKFNTDQNLFPTLPYTISTLDVLHKRGHKLGIFSEGTPRFQKIKLQNLAINHLLDKNLIFIGQSKRTENFLKQIPKNSFIVDDNPQIIRILNDQKSVHPIFLKRSRSSGDLVGIGKHKTISSLRDLLEMFK